MKIKTERRCGCRDTTGRKYPRGACPDLEQRGHGSWSFRFRVPKSLVALVGKSEISENGFPTKKAAEDAAEKAVARVHAGQQDIGGLTVRSYLVDLWLPGKQRLRPTSARRYEQYVRLHLLPYLGEIPLASLRAHQIIQAYQRVQADSATRRRPVGPSTIADAHAMFKSALGDAVRQRMIPFNPADGVELPSYNRPEVEPWAAEDVGVFLDEAAADRLAAMWELIALHGLRRGEACGASWPALDEEQAVLRITQQITEVGDTAGVWPPKTSSSKAKLDLDGTTLGSLLAHRLAQDSEREAIGAGWDNGILPNEHGKPVQLKELMFTRPDGRYLDPQWVTRRMWQIARRAGLCTTVRVPAAAGAVEIVVGMRYREPVGTWTLYVNREPVGEVTVVSAVRMSGTRARLTLAAPLPVDVGVGAELGWSLLSRRRLHDLRHSSASIQLAEGMDLALVSKRMRHSSTSITGNLYVHLLRSSGQKAAEAVAAAVPRSARRGHQVGTEPAEGVVSADKGEIPAGSEGKRLKRSRRRMRDSNSRGVAPNTLSKRAP